MDAPAYRGVPASPCAAGRGGNTGLMGDSATGPASSPAVHHEWIAGPGDARRAAASLAWRASTAPLNIGMTALVWLYLIVRAVLLGPDAWLAGVVIYPLALPALSFAFAYQGLRHSMPPGSQWLSGFGEQEMLIGSPVGRAFMPYRSITGVKKLGRLVQISTGGRTRTVLPEQICPPAAVEFVRTKIAR